MVFVGGGNSIHPARLILGRLCKDVMSITSINCPVLLELPEKLALEVRLPLPVQTQVCLLQSILQSLEVCCLPNSMVRRKQQNTPSLGALWLRRVGSGLFPTEATPAHPGRKSPCSWKGKLQVQLWRELTSELQLMPQPPLLVSPGCCEIPV